MRRLALAAGLVLAGCATPAPQDATDAAMTYACAGGKTFTAAYDLKGDRARVVARGRTYLLPHVRSASGARYAAGGVELWSKGDGARLEGAAGEPYDDCRTG